MAAKALIIAEKPSVGRDIAAALGTPFDRKGDYLEGERVIVTWAIGHLLRLQHPDEYKAQWKKWRMDDLPMVPDAFKLRPASPKTSSQLRSVVALLSRPDVVQVVNACDAGREGELIFRYIMQHARCRKPVKRLWLASLTPEAIAKGLKDMKDGVAFDPLAAAARSRSEADWLVGMNASRAATLMLRDALGGACSVGRVQTPTLALLVARELEIRNFVPEDFWVVQATFATMCDAGARRYDGLYRDGLRLTSAEEAQRVVDAVQGSHGDITKLERKQVEEKPPHLYDLTTLQREASGHFGFSAARTLEIAQSLYERHKLITYPRTDSRWLPDDQGAALPTLLSKLSAQATYAKYAQRLLTRDLPLKQVVNAAKVKDHYAIIPTGATPNQLSSDEAAVYDMVARRLLASLSPASTVERTRVETTAAGSYVFVTKGRVVLKPGWRAAYAGVAWFKTEEAELPPLDEGEAVRTEQVRSVKKQTQPPKRFTDAGLLGAMETAGKLVDDDDAREAMKESGLGTPATRAAIIERLIAVEYVARDKKALVPTDKGIQLIGLLGAHPLTSPGLTGEWERRLGLIERGAEPRERFMAELVAFTGQIVGEVRALAPKVAAIAPPPEQRPALGTCPSCGRPVYEGPKSFSCWRRGDAGCGFAVWKTIAKRKVPKGAVKELLKNGRTTKPLDGFKSKAGKPFSAHLKLIRDDAGTLRVAFDFAERPSG